MAPEVDEQHPLSLPGAVRLESGGPCPDFAQWCDDSLWHGLIVLSSAPDRAGPFPGADWLAGVVARRPTPPKADAAGHASVSLPDGGLVVWVWPALQEESSFERLSGLREGCEALFKDQPVALRVAFVGDRARDHAEDVIYTLCANAAPLPQNKSPRPRALQRLVLHDMDLSDRRLERARILAECNHLARALTHLPPNRLSPRRYRRWLRQRARGRGWNYRESTLAQLRRLGAGAFVAVAQGGDPLEAALVHIHYRHPEARARVALVGKGICFDTGGLNLKPARYMHGMHEDMNGSAVALAVLEGVQRLALPLEVDLWLALAQNQIGPGAYRQNEVITAIDGTTIEVVHTDAEGRLVLADALALAARREPALMIDFATLTGSMHTALGSRYSGCFASTPALAELAMRVGALSGERVLAFPFDRDYDSALDSEVADIKQCLLEGEADHILAARFLARFTQERPWVHVDLSAATHKGGLGAIRSDLTGFGVNWGVRFLDNWLNSGL